MLFSSNLCYPYDVHLIYHCPISQVLLCAPVGLPVSYRLAQSHHHPIHYQSLTQKEKPTRRKVSNALRRRERSPPSQKWAPAQRREKKHRGRLKRLIHRHLFTRLRLKVLNLFSLPSVGAVQGGRSVRSVATVSLFVYTCFWIPDNTYEEIHQISRQDSSTVPSIKSF